MEGTNGLLPRTCLFHRLGRSSDGSNHMEGLWVYQVLGNKCTSFGHDALYLQVAILCTQHLVDKLTKWPCIDKIVHYQQCFLHPMKPNQPIREGWTNYNNKGWSKVFYQWDKQFFYSYSDGTLC